MEKSYLGKAGDPVTHLSKSPRGNEKLMWTVTGARPCTEAKLTLRSVSCPGAMSCPGIMWTGPKLHHLKIVPKFSICKKFYRKALPFETNSFQSLANFNVKKWKCLCSSPFKWQHQVLLSHQYKEVCNLWYLKPLPSSFWNIVVKDKHVFSWCLENTKHTHYSKVFILWQQYLHCISY